MSRYVTQGKSVTTGITGGITNSSAMLFWLYTTNSTYHAKARRLLFGVTGSSTPAQITVSIGRGVLTTAATPTSSTPQNEDSLGVPSLFVATTAFSTLPTVTPTASVVTRTFDVLAESEWVLELPDEIDTGQGNSTLASATALWCWVPTGYSLASGLGITWTLFHEE